MRIPTYLELNERHVDETIFIVGAGPQLASLNDHQLRRLESRTCIGLNWTTHKFSPTYFLSAYIGYVLLAGRGSPQTLLIHMRPVYEPPLVDGILTVRRLHFDETTGLTRRLEPPEPILYTLRNVALGATHLAFVMGARRVVYIGVEQRNRLHYFYDDEKLRRRLLDDIRKLENYRHLFNIDHDNATLQAMIEVVQSDVVEAGNTPFYKMSHVETFRAYFDILADSGIEVYSTRADSVVSDAGAAFRPLEEFI